jgi:hypothetical protein
MEAVAKAARFTKLAKQLQVTIGETFCKTLSDGDNDPFIADAVSAF